MLVLIRGSRNGNRSWTNLAFSLVDTFVLLTRTQLYRGICLIILSRANGGRRAGPRAIAMFLTTSLPLVLRASRLIKHETWKIGGLEESSVFVSSIDIYASTLDDESDGSSMEGQEIDT